jgi:hypothetical protein
VLLERQQDPRLVAYVVWVPKLYGQESDVPTATKFVPDPRATHFWDGSAVLVHGYDTVLGIDQDAWDVYMIYGPTARWDGPQAPHPDFWMTKLRTDKAPRFDATVFAGQANMALSAGR